MGSTAFSSDKKFYQKISCSSDEEVTLVLELSVSEGRVQSDLSRLYLSLASDYSSWDKVSSSTDSDKLNVSFSQNGGITAFISIANADLGQESSSATIAVTVSGSEKLSAKSLKCDNSLIKY